MTVHHAQERGLDRSRPCQYLAWDLQGPRWEGRAPVGQGAWPVGLSFGHPSKPVLQVLSRWSCSQGSTSRDSLAL